MEYLFFFFLNAISVEYYANGLSGNTGAILDLKVFYWRFWCTHSNKGAILESYFDTAHPFNLGKGSFQCL